jgi:glycine cleavage system H protein
MEGFTYTNIFETKGIEYIVIIAFLILLIPFWIIINKRIPVGQKVKEAWDVLTANILRIPQGLFYSPNHTWAFLEKSGNAKIGLDDFLVRLVGEAEIIPALQPGQHIKKGEILAEINQHGKRLKVYAPITGEIIETNEVIEYQPDKLEEDPYGEGWIYSVKPSNWKAETNGCCMGLEARDWLNKELTRFKDFLAVSLGKHAGNESMVAFQEGGELIMHPMKELQSEIWDDFQATFLDG